MFELADADGLSEAEFELTAAKAMMCIYPGYHCFPFGGTFRFEDNVSRPDFALVAKDLSHWFVVEVELVSHSLEGHVLPQIRTFRFGDPQPDCISVLAKALSMSRSQMQTFLMTVPRSVVVIANKRHRDWEAPLRTLQAQLLIVSSYRSAAGVVAVEVDGKLVAQQEHLAWGQYMATDQAVRFHRAVPLPDGEVMVDWPDGAGALWVVTRDSTSAWVAKTRGVPDLPAETFVQLLRVFGNRYMFRLSPV